MERVICLVCKSCGFTASPDHVRCECGGKLIALEEEKERNEKNKPQKSERKNYESLTCS